MVGRVVLELVELAVQEAVREWVVVQSAELAVEVGISVILVILVVRVVRVMGTVEMVAEDVLLAIPICIVLDVLAMSIIKDQISADVASADHQNGKRSLQSVKKYKHLILI